MDNSFEKGSTSLEPKFTPELRLKLSNLFMEFLDNRKIPDKRQIEFALNVVGVSKSELIVTQNLGIFKNALIDLIESSDFPDGKIKTTLKIHLNNLSNLVILKSNIDKLLKGTISDYDLSKLDDPIDSPISGVTSYPYAVEAILTILKEVLTPEVNLVLDSFKEKIFLEPLKEIIENGDKDKV